MEGARAQISLSRETLGLPDDYLPNGSYEPGPLDTPSHSILRGRHYGAFHR